MVFASSNWRFGVLCMILGHQLVQVRSNNATDFPSETPTGSPIATPSSQPSGAPSPSPSLQPSNFPSLQPSTQPTSSPTFTDKDQDNDPLDCDDSNPNINRNAPEICNDGIDNNCDGQVDEQPCVQDFDDDGFFEIDCGLNMTELECLGYETQVTLGVFPNIPVQLDCNDSDNTTFPGAMEICGDGIDQNCDGVDSTCAPSSAPSFLPTLSNEPSSAPTSSMKPSQVPSFSPSSTPSGMPSQGPSDKPSSFPSAQPSGQPSLLPTLSGAPSSHAPSAGPSKEPTGMPSSHPSAGPTSLESAGPSMAPTESPTEARVRVLGTFRNLSIQLGVSRLLGPSAISQLEKSLVDAVRNYYKIEQRRQRNLRRSLAQKGQIHEVDTSVVFRKQELVTLEDGGEILQVAYDQNITFTKPTGSSISASDVLLEPFDDPATVEAFVTALEASDEDFKGVTIVSSPKLSSGEGEEGDSNTFTIAIIVGVVAAVVAVSVCLFITLRVRNKDPPSQRFSEPLPSTIEPMHKSPSLDHEEVSAFSDPMTMGSKSANLGNGDQSIETVDYDYSKAYGGGQNSVVSSAGGTMGELTRGTGSGQNSSTGIGGRSVLGASFDSESRGGHKSEPIIQEQMIEISAPPGKLGVVIDTPNTGAPVVHAVKDSSVIGSLIAVGDQLIMLDDIDVSNMTAIKVSKLISKKSTNPQRKLTIVRKVVIEPGDDSTM